MRPTVPARSVERRAGIKNKTSSLQSAGSTAGHDKEERHDRKSPWLLAAAALGVTAIAEPALAQNEQFLPALVYRTGPYAPNGIPFADGVADYWTLLNERDGGINGVKLTSEECETGYATDKGVECYERLKGKGPTGAGYFSPLSTGITFALTEKAPGDKIPLLTMGYGRSESRERRGVPVELHRRRQLLDRGRRRHPAHRQGARRHRQAEGQEDQPRLSRQPVRQGADPGARGARQAQRLHLQGDPGHASGRRAEVAVAGDPPGPARLRAAVGLGRDELHRDQGSGGGRLSARQDDRRVVVGRRA